MMMHSYDGLHLDIFYSMLRNRFAHNGKYCPSAVTSSYVYIYKSHVKPQLIPLRWMIYDF
jgi:hypothetical protein